MWRGRKIQTLAIAGAMATASVVGVAPAAAADGGIGGTVTDSAGPLTGIQVCAFDDVTGQGTCDNTRSDGTYELSGLTPSDSYRVDFFDPDKTYVGEYYNDAPSFDDAELVTVADNEFTSGIDAELDIGGSISGFVTDTDGIPLDGIEVCAFLLVSFSGSCGITDIDGTYTVTALGAGDHEVFFSDPSGAYSGERYDDLDQVFYDFQTATLVTVQLGADSADIDAQLELGGSIAGTVTDADGPIADFDVCLERGPSSFSSYCTSTAPDGSYEFTALRPAADYLVQFADFGGPYLTEYWDNVATSEAATPILVQSGQASTGIDALVEIGGSISGTVSTPDGPIEFAQVCAAPFAGGLEECDLSQSDGTYEILGLGSGDYRVRFSADALIEEYWDNSPRFADASPVSVLAGTMTTAIDAVLDAGGAIAGTLTSPSGAPVQGAFVCASSESLSFSSCALSEADGTYEVEALLPATDYLVSFQSFGDTIFEYYDDQSNFESATLVTVADGATTANIDAVLQPIREFHLLSEACSVLDLGPISGGDSVDFAVAGSIPGSQNPGTPNCPIPPAADAVFANIIVQDPSAGGNLRLTAAGTVPMGGIVNFAGNGLDNSNAQNVPLSSDQRLNVSVNGGPTGQGQVLAGGVSVEILGWWGPPSEVGFTYQSVTPCAFFDTRSNQGGSGSFAGPFAVDTQFSPTVAGAIPNGQGGGNSDCFVPESSRAALVNVVLINSTGDVGVTSTTTGATIVNNIDQTPKMNNASAVVVPVNDSGEIELDLAVASGDTHVRAVVLGYFSPSFGLTYVPLTPCATFDTRSNTGAAGSFAGPRLGDQETIYDVTGTFDASQGGGSNDCGVPEDVAAIELNLVAINPIREGNLRASAVFAPPSGGVLNFNNLATPMNNSNAIVLPVSFDGRIAVGVNGGQPGIGLPTTDIRGVVTGYYVYS